jgi:ribonucleoside-triphosphate reductase
MEPSDVRSMCCRLRLDLRELRKKTGGFFGSGESTGSVGVVTINMPRIAYLSNSKSDFFKRLDHMMDIAARSLKIKRGVISKLLNEGLYPYTKRYLGSFDNHFSTIGLIGMNEVGLNANWLRADMTDKHTQEFTKEVLNHMRNRLSDYQEEYGDLYNLEATPAESTTYRLAKHDKKRYPGIKTAGHMGDTPYYTNSSHLPVDYTADIFDALDIQDDLQTLYTSGTVFHAFLGEKLPDWKAAAELVRTIAQNYKLPYYTLSPTYSICKEHGYLAGEKKVCPHCGRETEVYSRITGYYRPVKNWNDGKLQEYANRTEYDIENSALKKPTTSVVTISSRTGEDALQDVSVQTPEDMKYLFTTKTCPNCKLAKEYLKNEKYIVIDAEENMELVKRYSVMQAPTLVIVGSGAPKKYVNASRIKEYVDSRRQENKTAELVDTV